MLFSRVFLIFAFFTSVVLGVAVGLGIATTRNIQSFESFADAKPAVGSQILDINGEVITELFSSEKREIISIDSVPKHLIHALLTREDKNFYEHHGFSIAGLMRAFWNNLIGEYFSGGSSITQQLAGHRFSDRTEITYRRKLEELWWTIQLERRYTKNEILEDYLNRMYFGHNTYGVEAASQFYFKHSAHELSLAESAMLVIQLNAPGHYSPINHPNRAKRIQREILDQMVELGYTSPEEADLSFQEYWDNYDFTRTNVTSAWIDREDKAPYFSEYVRQQLENLLLGAVDPYKDGLVIHTTLNLDYQRTAQEIMSRKIREVNDQYQRQKVTRLEFADETFLEVVDLLSLVFNIDDIRVAGTRQNSIAKEQYLKELNPVVDLLSSLFTNNGLRYMTKVAYKEEEQQAQQAHVEGALISIDSRTGYIYAMVGGRQFESMDQLNRATQSSVQPGSSFKPLYYSAAIDSRKFTTASMIVDAPVVFWNDDGTEYTPLNYKGEWEGRVLLRKALAHSMNIPSLHVLDGIGFDAAIDRASRMLGYTEPEEIERIFPRRYPLGLGVVTVSPLRMAKAYATFPNQGKEVTPIAIRYIEDRNGRIIYEPEKELRAQQERAGSDLQIMSPQTAYIMTNILQSTVKEGTLWYANYLVGGFKRPIGGKTGTTHNWSDAWTVGFTPLITSAVWFGFDEWGHSLGVNLSGAISAGPTWGEYMYKIHETLPVAEFVRPESGLVEKMICTRSGLLPTEYCEETRKEIFLIGTEPREFCELCKYEMEQKASFLENMKNSTVPGDIPIDEIILPALDAILGEELFGDIEATTSQNQYLGNSILDGDSEDHNFRPDISIQGDPGQGDFGQDASGSVDPGQGDPGQDDPIQDDRGDEFSGNPLLD